MKGRGVEIQLQAFLNSKLKFQTKDASPCYNTPDIQGTDRNGFRAGIDGRKNLQ